MERKHGIQLLCESEGLGKAAAKGDQIVFNMKMFLNRGDEVPLNEHQAAGVPEQYLRIEGKELFVDHTITLGRRQAIAGIEHALVGMRVGGYRRVRVSPHLAYREQGVPGLIPKNAVLVIDLWLRTICDATPKTS